MREGGHNVPAAKVQSRWDSSLANFVRFAALVDEVVLFNNAGGIPAEVGYKNLNGQFVLLDPDALPDISARLGRS